jgi:hypothetical protein
LRPSPQHLPEKKIGHKEHKEHKKHKKHKEHKEHKNAANQELSGTLLASHIL